MLLLVLGNVCYGSSTTGDQSEKSPIFCDLDSDQALTVYQCCVGTL